MFSIDSSSVTIKLCGDELRRLLMNGVLARVGDLAVLLGNRPLCLLGSRRAFTPQSGGQPPLFNLQRLGRGVKQPIVLVRLDGAYHQWRRIPPK